MEYALDAIVPLISEYCTCGGSDALCNFEGHSSGCWLYTAPAKEAVKAGAFQRYSRLRDLVERQVGLQFDYRAYREPWLKIIDREIEEMECDW